MQHARCGNHLCFPMKQMVLGLAYGAARRCVPHRSQRTPPPGKLRDTKMHSNAALSAQLAKRYVSQRLKRKAWRPVTCPRRFTSYSSSSTNWAHLHTTRFGRPEPLDRSRHSHFVRCSDRICNAHIAHEWQPTVPDQARPVVERYTF